MHDWSHCGFMHVCLASKSDAPAQPEEEEGEEKEEEKEAEPETKGPLIWPLYK